MKVDMYKTAKSSTFIAVEAGSAVPPEVTKEWDVKDLFKSNVDLSGSAPPIGMDPKQVVSDIQAKGYAVVKVSIQFGEGPARPKS
jgi:hypothetical protein